MSIGVQHLKLKRGSVFSYVQVTMLQIYALCSKK